MSLRVTWVQPEDVLRHELVQSAAEGRDVTAIRERWVAAGGDPEPPVGGVTPEEVGPGLSALARALLEEVATLPAPDADPAHDELASIDSAARPVESLPLPTGLDLEDRVGGAWLGRAIGCVLGKPVEKVPRQGIRAILEATGRWPLDGWFTAVGLPAEVAERWPWNRASRTTSLEECLDGMPEDDDINYAFLALSVLERHGDAFSTDDVARAWLDLLPGGRVFTAERVAYRNILDGLRPPDTARVGNPYREWIGAQIRTDAYGWTHPGRPRLAAELAWRDARLSHTRDGIHGARYAAALASAALVSSDVGRVLDAGASVVPDDSRLGRAIAWARGFDPAVSTFEVAVDGLYERWGDLHWVHVLPNAALVTLALVFGEGDFGRSICLCVQGGLDTDSNGATVGSVVGGLVGRRAIPGRWSEPLRDRIASSMPGFDGIGFGELTGRTLALVAR